MTRYGTVAVGDGTRAFRMDDGRAHLLPAGDVGAALRERELLDADGDRIEGPEPARLRPPVLAPQKFVCVGLNYRDHAAEVGKPVPEYPTLFAKYASAMVGVADDIELPPRDVSDRVDWEGELVIVLGARVFGADVETASAAIFGYTAMNDVSMRDWQSRTPEWLQGKNFERTSPVGPVIVTADELDVEAGIRVETFVNDRLVQSGNTADLVFTPAQIVSYVSSIMSLEPGDMIATGTPAGVGMSRRPPEFLDDGDLLVTRIEGIGELRNRCVRRAS